MNRRKARESAFLILFEKEFNNLDINEIIENGQLLRNLEVDCFTNQTINGVLCNIEKIDQMISENIKNWKKERLSKVSLILLRMGTYEIIFSEDVPTSVSINEAIELSKKYSTPEDTSFINGVLGGIVKKNGDKSV